MGGQQLSQRDLEDFARRLLQYAQGRQDVDISWFTRTTVGDLWELLGDLPPYAFRKGWGKIEKFTAKSLTPWDETYRAGKAYLQVEGYVFGRQSIANLPTDNRKWDGYFFGGNHGAWLLLQAWAHYLRHSTWLQE